MTEEEKNQWLSSQTQCIFPIIKEIYLFKKILIDHITNLMPDYHFLITDQLAYEETKN